MRVDMLRLRGQREMFPPDPLLYSGKHTIWDMSAWMAGPSKELRASPVGAEEESPGKQPLASAFKGSDS